MRTFLIAAASLLACSPAFAQTTANPPSQQNSQMTSPQVQGDSQFTSPQAQQDSRSSPQAQIQQTTIEMAQQIKSNLERAGFKNITLVPSSFIVRANDQNNSPVVMVVNPGLITAVNGTKDHNTIGQGAGRPSGNDNASGSAQPGR